MDNEQPDTQGKPIGERRSSGAPTTASSRQLARNKGLAWVKAITLGVGAAGVLGTVAIAATLPGSTSTASVLSATVASTPVGTSNDGGAAASGSSDDNGASDDSGEQSPGSAQQGQPAAAQRQPAAPQQQLQPAAPPSNTNNPPSATSGGS